MFWQVRNRPLWTPGAKRKRLCKNVSEKGLRNVYEFCRRRDKFSTGTDETKEPFYRVRSSPESAGANLGTITLTFRQRDLGYTTGHIHC